MSAGVSMKSRRPYRTVSFQGPAGIPSASGTCQSMARGAAGGCCALPCGSDATAYADIASRAPAIARSARITERVASFLRPAHSHDAGRRQVGIGNQILAELLDDGVDRGAAGARHDAGEAPG